MNPAGRLAFIVVGAVLGTASVLMPTCAEAQTNGAISGVIRTATGKPQAGATVEVFSSKTGGLTAVETALTDQRGRYVLGSLLPGEYAVRVSAPAFLPSLREHVNLSSNSKLVLNITLNTIFKAEQMLPARRTNASADDDWKWTLRSSANRPVLRVFDPEPAADDEGDGLSASLAVMAGGGFDGLGGMPSVATDFDVTQGWKSGNMNFRGNVGYGGRDPDGTLRVAFSPKSGRDGQPASEVAFEVRRANIESPHLAQSAVNTYGLSFAHTVRILDLVDLRAGGRIENSSVIGRQVYLEPLLDAAVGVGKNGRVFYRQGWNGTAEDDPAIGARLSYTERGVAMERGLHQETGYEYRVSKNHVALSYYRDTINNLALTGIGQMEYAGPDATDDILAGSDLESFTANVARMHAQGVKIRWERQLTSSLKTSAHAGYGTVLTSGSADSNLATLRAGLRSEMLPQFGGEMVLKAHGSEVESSYNMTVGQALTPVDITDSRSIGSAPFWNVSIRQPLPSFLPAHMDALIEVRNLLAQGYHPVLGQDGRTLYLVQAPRALRGGLAFTF